MTNYNVNIPAAVPRTLIRTPQLNPVLAAMRNAQAGMVLKGAAPGVVTWGAADLTAGSAVDVAVPVTENDGAWTIKTQGSASDFPASNATWEGPRTALLWLQDTREGANAGAAMVVDVRENYPGPDSGPGSAVARTGIHVKINTRPDRGESSAALFVQSGGGGTLTAYKTHRLRPVGKLNLAYSAQGALEVATDDMSFAALIQSGAGFTSSPADPPLTVAIAATGAVPTISVSDSSGFPVPGGAVPYISGGSGATWPTPLYVLIESECFSYTGVDVPGKTLTGCVRAVPSTTMAAHGLTKVVGGVTVPNGVQFICASNAMWLRFAWPISKGIVAFPSDGASFDTRDAFCVGLPSIGGVRDTGVLMRIRLNGDIETAGNISAGNTLNSVNFSCTGAAGIAGVERLTGVVTPVPLTGNTDNYGPPNLATARVLRIQNTGGPFNLTGIVQQPNGTLLTLVNVGVSNIVLVYNAGTSAAANRFLFGAGANVTLTPQGAITLWWDGTAGTTAWRPLDAR